jgi:hypothetical protein
MYCVKCRTHTADLNPQITTAKNGLKRISCQCSDCGCNKSSFLPKNDSDKKVKVVHKIQTRNIKTAKSKVPECCEFDEYTGTGLKEWMAETGRRWRGVKMSVKGERTNYKPSMRNILSIHGNKEIVDVKVCRRPINQNMGKIIEIYRKIRGMSEIKQHDTYFHLYLVVTLSDGIELLLEKNHDLNVDVFKSNTIDECIQLNYTNDGLTPNKMLENSKRVLGASFTRYDALDNNCQMFVHNMLIHSNIDVSDAQKQFILQDTKGLLDSFGQKLARLATSTLNRIDTVIQGEGIEGLDDE